MDEIVKDFLIESNENLDRLDQELVKLESEPSSKELLGSVFRTIHTIKGSCGFLGFARLEKLAHAGESLLSRLRDGKLSLNTQITSGLLAMVDAVRRMLAAIQASGQDGEEDYKSLIDQLARLQGDQVGTAQTLIAAMPAGSPRSPESPAEAEAPKKAEIVSSVAAENDVQNEPAPPSPPNLIDETQETSRPTTNELVRTEGAVRTEDAAAPEPAAESHSPQATMETIRVGVTLLDRLMNLVGELVLARNQLLQFSNSTQDAGFQAVSQRMNLIATELQEEVMKTRMQPIGNIWNKFPAHSARPGASVAARKSAW